MKCLQMNGVLRKSCCASLDAKQTSRRNMSALGTKPVADRGRDVTMFSAQDSLYVDGRGRNAEWKEEVGGRRCGAANCSKSTAHSVGRNAGGFFHRTTCAHVGTVAMVLNINLKFSFCKCVE